MRIHHDHPYIYQGQFWCGSCLPKHAKGISRVKDACFECCCKCGDVWARKTEKKQVQKTYKERVKSGHYKRPAAAFVCKHDTVITEEMFYKLIKEK